MKNMFILPGLAALLLLGGCVAPPFPRAVPAPADLAFPPEAVDKIYVVGVVNAPADPRLQADCNEAIYRWIKIYLARKRYPCDLPSKASLVAGITLDDLQQERPEAMAKAAPASARWVMFFATGELLRVWEPEFGYWNIDCSVELSAWLLDQQTGKVVWRNKGQGFYAGGSAVADYAVHRAMHKVMAKFPERPVRR
jgi:hypothetical protein